jgi:hypothetical protein
MYAVEFAGDMLARIPASGLLRPDDQDVYWTCLHRKPTISAMGHLTGELR